MTNVVWAELVKFAKEAENFVEGVEEHIAILFARKVDADRRATDAAAPVADLPPPVDPLGSLPTADVPAGTSVDANGMPV